MRRERKRAKTGDISHVLTSDASAIARIAYRRSGVNSVHDFALILYTPLSCAINTQILNCPQNGAIFPAIFVLKNNTTTSAIKSLGIHCTKSNVYKINTKSCAESAPVLRFLIRAIARESRVKACENRRI